VIPDDGHQEMRDAALEVIRDLGIQGGCNIQFAWHDDGTPGGEYRVVEVNPRVSLLRARVEGDRLPDRSRHREGRAGQAAPEIDNEITGETTAAFEPAIDYVVTKVPRWPIDKFDDVDFELGTAMKSTGEAMAIGRNFEESLLKSLRSSEYDPAVDWPAIDDETLETEYLERPTPDRPYAIFEAFDRGYTVADVEDLTGIKPWYLERFKRVSDSAQAAQNGEFAGGHRGPHQRRHRGPRRRRRRRDRGGGRSRPDVQTGRHLCRRVRRRDPVLLLRPSVRVQPGTAEGRRRGRRARLVVDKSVDSVVVVGGGPIRIGQGVEFDYCSVHAIQALRELGIEAHVVNNNPETVSTDYDTSDGLFFDPITAEEVADVVEATGADGVMVQFGGQTSVNIGEPLEAELQRRGLDCEIMGTSVEAMDLAEDRDRFNVLMDEMGIAQPKGGTATSESEALELAHDLGYPVLVRPSYVLGGRAMRVVEDDAELEEYIEEAVRVSPDKPILVDQFLDDAVELDVDAVADGDDVLLGGVMEHVESAGVHSGDSACMIPPRSLGEETLARVREVTEDIARALDTVGLLNVQLAVTGVGDDDAESEVYVLEANPRSSRTVPFVSKSTGVPIAKLAAKVMTDDLTLADLDVDEQIPEHRSVKEVVLPFDRLPGSDPRLGPEMKSTGEVMGTARSFGKAYDKAQDSTNKPIPESGTAVVDLSADEFPDPDTEAGESLVAGYAEHFELSEATDLIEAAKRGEIDLIVSRQRELLEVAVEEEITYFSTHASAKAALEAIDHKGDDLDDVMAVSDRPKRVENWGAAE